MEAAEGKTGFLGLCDIADVVIRARMLDKFLRTPEPAVGVDEKNSCRRVSSIFQADAVCAR